MKLHEYPVIVVVFGMKGCPGCQEYVPRFRAIAAQHAGCVPAAVLNTDEVDDHWLHRYGIAEVPCTLILRYGKITARRDRPVEDRTISHLFGLARFGNDCAVDDDA